MILIHFAASIKVKSPEQERIQYLLYASIATIFVLFCLISICVSSCLSLIVPKATHKQQLASKERPPVAAENDDDDVEMAPTNRRLNTDDQDTDPEEDEGEHTGRE